MTAAGVHDDTGAFPRFDESFAGVRAVELQSHVIHVIRRFNESGGVGFHFPQERAAVDDSLADK